MPVPADVPFFSLAASAIQQLLGSTPEFLQENLDDILEKLRRFLGNDFCILLSIDDNNCITTTSSAFASPTHAATISQKTLDAPAYVPTAATTASSLKILPLHAWTKRSTFLDDKYAAHLLHHYETKHILACPLVVNHSLRHTLLLGWSEKQQSSMDRAQRCDALLQILLRCASIALDFAHPEKRDPWSMASSLSWYLYLDKPISTQKSAQELAQHLNEEAWICLEKPTDPHRQTIGVPLNMVLDANVIAHVTEVFVRDGWHMQHEQLYLPTAKGSHVPSHLFSCSGYADVIHISGVEHLCGFSCSLTDVTRLKEAAAQYSKTQERLTLAVQGTNDGLWDIPNMHGKHTLWFSPRLYEILGYAPEEIIPTRGWIYQRTHHEDKPILDLATKKTMSGHDTYDAQIRIRRKDDTYIWLRIRGRSVAKGIDDTGKPFIRLAGSAQDITPYKTTEAALAQAVKMGNLGNLVSGVVHDFNNFLTVVDNCAKFALEDLALGNLEDTVQNLEDILASAKRTSSLTRQMLTFSKPASGQKRIIDASHNIQESIRLFSRLAPQNIKIISTVSKAPLMLDIDPSELDQIFFNLCINAKDAMQRGGELRITVKSAVLKDIPAHALVRPTASSTKPMDSAHSASLQTFLLNQYFHMTIKDNGAGMAPEVLAKVLQPFFTTKGAHGTGLGLSMIERIVVNNDGGLHMESQLDTGTSVHVFLPLCKPKDNDSSGPVIRPTGNEHILVAEDDNTLSNIMLRVLQRAGYRVSLVRNGLEAKRLFEAAPQEYGLVILDAVMPQHEGAYQNGFVVGQNMRERRPDLPLLIIGSSNLAADHHDVSLVTLSNIPILVKPYSEVDLLSAVRSAIDAAKAIQHNRS